ncbi:hypothetical protein SAMN05421686_1122 [Thalassolituus maritimus]|uniref:Uncharacterized protein n=1 Tax=Thalassolituus maritimus TaxID=484498 RepID=A0A1N7PXD5_9GAMM|nr:hypothetical protein SAMN05421686_1122 [Thalassolituus maritimus]
MAALWASSLACGKGLSNIERSNRTQFSLQPNSGLELILNLRKNVQDEFNREIQERMKSTVWAQGCTSWYQTDTGKNTNNWPGSTLEYRKRTRRLNLVHYAT